MKRTYCQDCLQLAGRKVASCPSCGARRPSAGWPDDPLIGTAVGGKYRVLRRLGREAIGVIYLAVHVELEARRALKVLDARLAHDERIRGRFEREARALYRLNPRYIVRLEDFGEARPGLPFMALEYVEGSTLAEVLASGGPLEPPRALRLARQVAVALVDAAEEGVLHRDLRPENIVLREHPVRGEEIKVLDFGIAKILGEHTLSRSGATTRTGALERPEYVAPEQWMADVPSDARADLFAVGVLLFELVSGETPWAADGEDPFEVMRRMREEPPRRLDALASGLPAGLAELVARLAAVDPEERPASARELVAEIDRLGLLTTSVFEVVGERSSEQSDGDETRPSDLEDTQDLIRRATARTVRSRRRREVPTAPGPSVDRGAATVQGASRLRQPDPPPSGGRRLTALAAGLALIAVGLAAYALVGELPRRTERDPEADRPLLGSAGARDGGPVDAVVGEPPREPLGDAPNDMVRIPGGLVRIGASEAERRVQAERFGDGAGTLGFGPPRTVDLRDFLLDRHEVALGDFAAWRLGIDADEDAPCGDGAWRSLPLDDPVTPIRGVSYEEALAYCEALDRRLPTFEEWEAAARGQEGNVLPWTGGWEARGAFNTGRADQPLYGMAADARDGYPGLAPIAALGESGWRIVGLGGNVSEWVTAPDGRGHAPPHFHRGGSYLGHPVFALSFAHQFVADRCASWPTVGFRCAMDPH